MRLTIEQLKENSYPLKGCIKFTKESYYGFSNFTPSTIFIVDEYGFKYHTVENFYQASKTMSKSIRRLFIGITPYQSKKLARTYPLRDDWGVEKYNVMREGLRQKFQDEVFGQLLKLTGNRQIIEWTWWGDIIWGMSSKTGEGCNALGKLLMELREEKQ